MYCIVFSGRLLDGYDSMTVRKAVADRLNLDAEQVERLFSGERIVLKNGVTEESGQVYLGVLRRLGMDAGLVEMSQAKKKRNESLATFKIVSWGRILDGFDRQTVMRDAAKRLRASQEQVEILFNGSKAVLKRGVTADVGSRYVVELARIGMQIELEVETSVPGRHAPGSKPRPRPEGVKDPSTESVLMSKLGADLDAMYQGLLETQYELPSSLGQEPDHTAAGGKKTAARRDSSLRTVPAEALPPSAKAKSSVIRQAKQAEYVRCPICGQRQAPGTRCRACGVEFAKPSMVRKAIPMDASAHASQTTILGNMPPAMMRNVAAESSGKVKAASLHHHMLAQQPAATSRQSVMVRQLCMVIGVVLVVSLAAWWFI